MTNQHLTCRIELHLYLFWVALAEMAGATAQQSNVMQCHDGDDPPAAKAPVAQQSHYDSPLSPLGFAEPVARKSEETTSMAVATTPSNSSCS